MEPRTANHFSLLLTVGKITHALAAPFHAGWWNVSDTSF